MTPSPNTCAEVGVCAAYVAHHARLAAWATSLVGDRELAQDLTVEAFARLFSHWESVQAPRPWLYATVANLARDHWRSRQREAAAYERFQGGLGGTDAAAPASDLAAVLSVRTAVRSLPARLRLPVLLYYFADESVAEVARDVGRSPGAVKRDLHDARALLAASLAIPDDGRRAPAIPRRTNTPAPHRPRAQAAPGPGVPNAAQAQPAAEVFNADIVATARPRRSGGGDPAPSGRGLPVR